MEIQKGFTRCITIHEHELSDKVFWDPPIKELADKIKEAGEDDQPVTWKAPTQPDND
jgi:D-hexose-6-phosphate mutarotase